MNKDKLRSTLVAALTEGLTLVFELDGSNAQSKQSLANIQDICGPDHFPDVLFTDPPAIFDPEVFGRLLGQPSSSKAREWHTTLGVDEGASLSEIKKAYRQLALKAHPDKGGDQQTFLNITEAYAGLTSTPVRPSQYRPQLSWLQSLSPVP